MKSKRLSMVSMLMLAMMIVLVVALAFGGCAKQAPTPAPAPAPAAKTLKVGLVYWAGWPVGLNMLHTVQTQIDRVNKNGGLAVGNDKYTIKLIPYDSQFDQAIEVAAVNRLVFQDNVKFIISDGAYVAGWLSITEPNKVITLASTPHPAMHDPKNSYTFMPAFLNTSPAVVVGWFAKNYPDKKSFAAAYQDEMTGHMVAGQVQSIFEAFGLQKTDIFYPPMATDLSSVGTQVKQLNPDVFIDAGRGSIVYKAVRQAGYKGQLLSITARPMGDLLAVASAQDIEGLIVGALPTEFEPALTKEAADFKAAYAAKFGKWDDPMVEGVVLFDCLTTAIQKAGSLDTDKVASEIGNGLKYDTPVGPAQMIAHSGNNRTTDAVCTAYIKQIKGGKPEIIATVEPDEGLTYFQIVQKATTAPTPTQQPPPPSGAVVPWDQAKNLSNWGNTIIVTGKVDSVFSPMPPETIVVLGAAMPKGFPVIIPDPSKFPAGLIDSYVGKTIKVTGELSENSLIGGAQIKVTDPSQIVVE